MGTFLVEILVAAAPWWGVPLLPLGANSEPRIRQARAILNAQRLPLFARSLDAWGPISMKRFRLTLGAQIDPCKHRVEETSVARNRR